MQAGAGDPVLLLHGLGATKASFLPTVAALAGAFRVTAIDLPGFGDSAMPVGAAYDAAVLRPRGRRDARRARDRARARGRQQHGRPRRARARLRVSRAHGPARAAGARRWRGCASAAGRRCCAPCRPSSGLVQPAPRAIVDRIARAMVPGGNDGWSAVGVDEFLRGYLTPRGRAAFYAAARNIYLEDPGRALLEPPARAAGRGAVRLGPPGQDRADRVRPPRPRGAARRRAPRARLRPRAPARGAARDARRRRATSSRARRCSAHGERDHAERGSPPRRRTARAPSALRQHGRAEQRADQDAQLARRRDGADRRAGEREQDQHVGERAQQRTPAAAPATCATRARSRRGGRAARSR